MSTYYKPSDLEGGEKEEIFCWWLAMGFALGAISGTVNGFLISYQICPRVPTKDITSIAGYVVWEFVVFSVVGTIIGIAFGIINILFIGAGYYRPHTVKQQINQEDLQKALKLLTAASKEQTDKDILVCVGRAEECVLRAMGVKL